MSEEKRKCPVCAEEIPVDATVCKFCGEKLSCLPLPNLKLGVR